MALDGSFEEIVGLADDPHALTDAEVRDGVLAVQRLKARLAAAEATLVGEFDSRCLHAVEGARSAAAWMARGGGDTVAGTRATLKLARSLRDMPETLGALRTGAIGLGKARALAVGKQRCPERFGDAEGTLLEACRPFTADQTARLVARWLDCVQPDGAERLAKDAEGTVLYLSRTLDGWGDLQGRLCPEDLATVEHLLAEQMKRDLRSNADGRLADDGERPPIAIRRARALIELLARGINAEPDQRAVPSITVVADVATLEAAPGTPLAADGLSETDHGTPLHPEVIRRLACDAEIIPMVIDTGPRTSERAIDQRCRILGMANPEVLAVGRSMRTPNRAMRRALRASQRGCQFPGCDVGAAWCVPHHLDHWEHGGPTDLQNLVLLCAFHHHQVHEGGFRIRRDGIALTWLRPDGAELATTSPNHLPLRPLPPPPPPPERTQDPPAA